jgi:4-amino-4-deoxy-L-arabinose transferase-like glycosyltransferase
VACFRGLGHAPVFITNEAREGVYARAMLASGNFVAPSVPNHLENGEWIPDKPPLFHWLAAAAAWARATWLGPPVASAKDLASRFDEWALRAPSALAASLLIVVTAAAGAPLIGGRAALFAAAVLLTTFQFSYQARFGRVDMLLAALVTLATLLAGRALLERRPGGLYAAGGVAGLAVLAKGPLGIVLPGLACAAFLASAPPLLGMPRAALRDLPWRTALGAALAVALPWYVLSNVLSRGAVMRSQLFAENFDQFVGVGGRMRESFYLEPWLLDSFPWNLVALLALVAVWRRREPAAVFCAAWWLALLAFYQIAAYKRRAYLLPALPAEALLAGWYLDRVVLLGMPLPSFAVGEWLRRAARPILACIVAGLVGAVAAPAAVRAWVENGSLGPFDAAIAAGAGTACLFALGASMRAIRQGDRGAALLAAWLCLGSFYAAVLPTGMAVMGRALSPRSLVARIEGTLPPGSDLEICGIGADTSLVLLLYLSNPERARVKPEGSCVARPAPGFYVLSAVEWMRAARSSDASLWRVRLTDEVRGAKARTQIVFAERLHGVSAEPSGAAHRADGLSP